MILSNLLRKDRSKFYDSLLQDDCSATEGNPRGFNDEAPRRSFRTNAVLPWSLNALLLLALILVSFAKTNPLVGEALGTYESGFVTDIEPARRAISLQRKKFYGAVQVDKNGMYSLSRSPDGTNFFAPPSPELDAEWMSKMLLNGTFGFLKLTPEEMESSGLKFSKEDLNDGFYSVQPSAIHTLHCLNYIRKSLARDYYTEITDDAPRPYHISHRMHLDHCLENIRQHLICNFDMTWTPRSWRPEARVVHADTEQWHVCRNFDEITNWMMGRL